MDSNIFKHIPDYQVIVCTLCTEPHCVPPKGIADHLSTFHRTSLTKHQRASLVKYVIRTFPNLADPMEVKSITPPFENGPIDGVHKTYGYMCTDCGKLLVKRSSMEKHCHGHGWNTQKPDMWTRQWIQVCL
jgi:Orsellinic acid/F9775 biosynthesis cluster protein D